MLSIIIPTCNRPDAIKRTVHSILNIGIESEFEIIVINDHPQTPVEQFSDSRVKVIENEKNLGRSKSRNKGALASEGEYLFFLDDDIEVKENLFDRHVQALNSGYSAVYSNVKNVRTDGKYSFLNEFLNTRGANKKNSGSKLASYFVTQFCSLKKDFFKQIGMFDENFSGYGWEDTELGLRIEDEGGKISFIKTGGLNHYHDKDVFEWIDQIESGGRNLRYMINKYPRFKKTIHYGLLMSSLGAIAFNPLFVWSEKLKAKRSGGFFGYINYNYLFKAAVYRSLKRSV
ncbi:MAG: glycosyltransferase family 2 protein [Candidatus Delongbacteria bacterium]|nr:glycosyltransferase family 2 protein [Candidatus Delongbacteria bacterium]